MEKSRSSPLSFLFPWLSPRVIKFALANNGIEVQLWRNNRLFSDWNPSQLRHVLPEPLSKWMNDNHIHEGPQPYPLIKQLWHHLLPIASKKLVIDASVLAELEEVSQPQDFALIWAINHSAMCIEGRYEGADHYLGMGWFHKGTKIWQLKKQPSNAIDLLLQKPILPLEQTDFLLDLISSYLQECVSTHTEFQIITNFTIQVIVRDARSGGLTLALECNYPQFLSTIQIPQQQIKVLLAHQAIIRFPRQALTPVLMRLLQNGGSPVIIQGADVPLFISEQLPAMRHFSHISDDMATKIIQSNPIVSISALQPTFTVVHNYKNGIGLYNISAIYKYLKYEINMKTILSIYGQNQRFNQQYGFWFEWPYNAHGLADTIQQNITIQLLRSEEVMKFDMRRIGDLVDQSPIYPIQPDGTTPVELAQSIFEQLRHHGVPGGIVGEPKGLVTMFADACEKLLRMNQMARILWLVPSNKKSSVTRTIRNSISSSYVTVASLVTLRDEPELISRSWTLVIFQGLDILLDGSPQPSVLAQLKWLWALVSITSRQARTPFIMRVLHLPEQYNEQFHTHYLFDLEKNYRGALTSQRVPGLNSIQSAPPIVPKKDEPLENVPVRLRSETMPEHTKTILTDRDTSSPIEQSIVQLKQETILKLQAEAAQLQERLIIEEEEIQEPPPISSVSPSISLVSMVREIPGTPSEVQHEPLKNVPTSLKLEKTQEYAKADFENRKVTPSPEIQPVVQLNQETILKLQAEAAHLQERLTIEEEEIQEQPSIPSMSAFISPVSVVREPIEISPEINEDWQVVLQQWQPEHWEILRLLRLGQSVQLTIEERKDRRPISQLIDEINVPVDEHIGDLLIDPDTQTLSPHLRVAAENLVSWYYSSKR